MTVVTPYSNRRSHRIQNWHDANQQFLSQSLEQIRQALVENAVDQTELLNHELRAALNDDLLGEGVLGSSYDGQPFTVELIARIFDLNEFELSILLLCAGMELDGQWPELCEAVSGVAYPTFGLALSIFKKASWEVLTPSGTLRRSHLIEIGDRNTLVNSPLRIDERILHYLTGVQYLDERLQTIMSPVRSAIALVPSHAKLVDRISSAWTQSPPDTYLPAIQLVGEDSATFRTVAFHVCRQLGLNLHALPAEALPTDWQQLNTFSTLCEREYQLSNMAVLLKCEDLAKEEAARQSVIANFIQNTNLPLIVTSRDHHRQHQRPTISLNITHPTSAEQRQLWESGLGKKAKNWKAPIRSIVSQFNMGPSAIGTVCLQGKAADSPEELQTLCRIQARSKLDELAQRIETRAERDTLVLPEKEQAILQALVAHMSQRSRVYEDWGFDDKSSGISALFIGASGTGKTTAAEVISRELNMDVYRIELSSVVSKHVADTKKNLQHIFDAAKGSGVILLFDEAETLFSNHSQVIDAKDRDPNRGMNYLLKRMETYRGLSILKTNLESSMDSAFLRRFRFVIQFPFPDAKQRAKFWREVFPEGTPTEGLVPERLAKLSIAGGNIRNIALNAAFIAADAGEPVMMKHLLSAAKREYSNLERRLTDAEVKGWI